jgi:hypothetical protein
MALTRYTTTFEDRINPLKGHASAFWNAWNLHDPTAVPDDPNDTQGHAYRPDSLRVIEQWVKSIPNSTRTP